MPVLFAAGVVLADSPPATSRSEAAADSMLRLSIRPTKKVYKSSEPVDIELRVTNISSTTISIPTFQSAWERYRQNFLGAFVIELTAYRLQDGRRMVIPLERPAVSYLDFPDPESISLKPAAEWKAVVDLKRWGMPKVPGTYEVTAIWNVEPLIKMLGDRQFSAVRRMVESKSVTVELASNSSLNDSISDGKTEKDTRIEASIQKYINERHWKTPVPVHSNEIIAYGRDAVPYVIPLLDKQDIFIRTDAARILGEIGDERALPALATAMVGGPADKNVMGGGMRQACYEALLKLGEPSRTYFERFSKSEDSGLRFLGNEGLNVLDEKNKNNEVKK